MSNKFVTFLSVCIYNANIAKNSYLRIEENTRVKINYIFLIAAALSCCADAFSQNNSLGIFNSPKGFGLDYCRLCEDKAFFNTFNLYADMAGVFSGEAACPGIKFDFCHDIVIKDVPAGQSRCLIYAGPGISAGYLRDFKAETPGFMLGLNCSAGAKFIFERGFSLDIGFGAEIGMDLCKKNGLYDTAVTTLYKNGLIRFLFPQLKIEYSIK